MEVQTGLFDQTKRPRIAAAAKAAARATALQCVPPRGSIAASFSLSRPYDYDTSIGSCVNFCVKPKKLATVDQCKGVHESEKDQRGEK
jgi:hypothetical protein